MESEKWHLRICLFLLFITSSYSNVGKITSSQNLFGNTVMSQFNTKNNTRVIAQKGGLAILPCVVKVNSPATVSWIRRKDFQLLTVGLSTHSSDKRFLVEHTRHMGHWSLRIKAVKEEDRGLYECQLSIYPTQSIFIELKIVEAVAEISNSSDILIDESSTLQLQCKLKGATENPSFVFWYHENKMINYDAQGGFVVTSITENSLPSPENGYLHQSKTSSGKNKTKNSSKEPIGVNSINTSNVLSLPVYTSPVTPLSTLQLQQLKSPYLPNSSMSVLTIKTVTFHHAGNYTCAPSNARPASITVHVLRGGRKTCSYATCESKYY
ncbi:uncharacterized protein LOC117134991 [Drosophila busckii]|uniref:uncharacterized protein LOC117134991 n=1 Tax=Drosophila busckii TaxID=30019 RepID=UPI00143345F8|nr:uncharacterized protein LOC117134991 [Drosophila busckii]